MWELGEKRSENWKKRGVGTGREEGRELEKKGKWEMGEERGGNWEKRGVGTGR